MEARRQSRERVTHGEVLGESLKWTGIFKMLENVSSRVPPLNGVVAYYPRGKISFPSARLLVTTESAVLTIIS